jgi:hypothetical protein
MRSSLQLMHELGSFLYADGLVGVRGGAEVVYLLKHGGTNGTSCQHFHSLRQLSGFNLLADMREAWRSAPAPVRSGQFDLAIMASAHQSSSSLHRLADQLTLLSEVTEALTYRLLQFEEKLAGCEEPLSQLLSGQDPAAEEEMETRLLLTEEKLSRIEAMLNGLERTGIARHRSPVTPPSLQQELIPSSHMNIHALSEAYPFSEEGEQPFMDELIA